MQTTTQRVSSSLGPESGPPPLPAAVRLRRPGWRDPRLLLGVVLVAASVALGSWLVTAAGRTVPVLVARDALVPGDGVGVEALDVRDVRLPDDGALYLRPGDELPADLVAVRTVGAGELVPWSAVSSETDLALRPVAMRPARALSSSVVEGSAVDLWQVPADGPGPVQVAAGLTVAEVTRSAGAFTVDSGATVHVLVPVEDLPHVLAALAADGAVELVHVPGAAAQP